METLAHPCLQGSQPTEKPLQLRHRYYAWLIITLSSLFLLYKYVLQVSPSVMSAELMRYFHIDGAGLGNLAATFFYAYLITQLFVGPLLDKYSPRLLTGAAIIACSIGALLFSLAQSLLDAEVARALIGMGAAFATVSYMKLTSIWFKPSQFAFIGGLLATASMLGSMAGQVPLSLLMSSVGWRSALFICALLGISLAFVFIVFVKSKAPHSDKNYSLQQASIKWQDFLTLLRNKYNWYLMLYSGLAFSPLAVFGGLWGDPFLERAYHLSTAQAATLISCMFLGLAVGGPLFGLLSDRLKQRFSVMLVGLLLSLAALLLALYSTHLPVWTIGVFLFLFGFGTGAFMLGFTMGKEMNALTLSATVIALINTGDAIFGAFSEPMVGKLLDTFWQGKVANKVPQFGLHDFHLALAVLPLYLVAALGFLIALKRCPTYDKAEHNQ